MPYSRVFSQLVYEKCYTLDEEDFFPKRIDGSTMSFDDLFMIWKSQNSGFRYIKLCNSPKLNYLNLLDYEDKRGDFHSSIFERISFYKNPFIFPTVFEVFEQYSSVSMFCFYVEYLKHIPKDSIDLQVFDQKISRAAANLKYCDSLLLEIIYEEMIDLHSASTSDKILLPIILKHVCTSEELIEYTTEFIFKFCNASFFKGFLDACIISRFDFWTMWERNWNLNTIHFCPVTYAYSSAKLDFLKVLLDYGFSHTHHRVLTLATVLDERPEVFDLPWITDILFDDGLNWRRSVINEVFLFMCALFYSSRDSRTLAKCFLLSWNARKEPYVTKPELLVVFRKHFGCLPRRRAEQAQIWFQERFDEFQTSIRDYQGLVPQPRSLKHLCRCTVREALNDNWEMPHGVAKLPIPDAMKSYILLR